VADRAGAVTQQLDDMKAVGLGQRPKGCQHNDPNMPLHVYSCQGIFTEGNIEKAALPR
jgi:hypothetical protein